MVNGQGHIATTAVLALVIIATKGVFAGTFSKPMPLGNGKSIPPTGKKFRLPMATIAHWKDGKMTEESLFWDNGEFMKQIGLAK